MSLQPLQTEALIDAALRFAAMGWPVFPCSPQTKAPLLPNDIDAEGKKIPKTGGLKKASTDAEQIRAWWARWPKAMIGVATGHPTIVASGNGGRLLVLDFDPRTDDATGEEFTLERLKADLEAQMGCALPASLTSVTQSGGVHVWMVWPDDDGEPIGNRGNLPLHVDVRGLGGYVIAPPSVMTTGKAYRWLRREGETHDPARTRTAEAPAALVAILRSKGGAKGGADTEGNRSESRTKPAKTGNAERDWNSACSDDPVEVTRRKWALAALDSETSALARTPQGRRGEDLNRTGFSLGKIVGSGYLSEAMAVAGLVQACHANGLVAVDGIDMVQANAERAVNDGKGHPRDMSDVGALAGRSGGARPAGPWDDYDRSGSEPTHETSPHRHRLGDRESALHARLVAASSTLPSGTKRKDATASERAQLRLIGRHALISQLRSVVPGMTAEALSEVCYQIGRRIGAGLVDGESLDADTRSKLMALGILIAGSEDAQKALKRGRRKPIDVDALLLDLRCAQYPLTDFGIAERFNDRFGQDYRFTTAKGWLGYDGTRWMVLDQDEKTAPAEVIDALWRTIRAVQDEARVIRQTGESDPHSLDYAYRRGKAIVWHHEDVAAFGRSSETTGKPEGVQKLCRRWLTVPIERFDCDKLAVNVLNGTLRFSRSKDEAGQWRAQVALEPHSREHLNTKICPVAFDPDAACAKYDDFFSWAQPDASVRRYLRAVAGYTLTGTTGEQKLWFHYGRGANGKSTAFDIWAHVSGDYSGTIGIETFLDQGIKKRGEQASPDLARLGGVRFLRASEPERGAKLNEALIKAATGGEPMAVRALHRGFFDLLPAFKLHIAGNYKPDIPGTDEGIWRRMKLVPWSQHRAEHERNEALGEELKAEASGIFRWMVEGVLDWLENGLVEPEAVTMATAEYREDSDPLARFLKMCVEMDGTARTQSSKLHEVYAAWCKAAGEAEWKPKGFAKAMKDKGFMSKASNGIQWLGIRLVRQVGDFVDEHGRVIEMGDGDGAGDGGARTRPAADAMDSRAPPPWEDDDLTPDF